MGSFQKNIIAVCLLSCTILICVPEIEGRRCDIEEYWHRLFKTCEPCSQICKPLNRSDCARHCADYIRNLACPIDRYWSTVYDKCIPCSTICSPQNRTMCQSNCRRYIDSLKLEDTTTDTVPIPTTYTPLAISDWAKENVVVIGIIASLFVLSIIWASIALYLCRPKVDQYLQCGRNGKRNTNNVQIQVTDDQTTMRMIATGEHTQDTLT